jgi:hypothetical protein
VWQQYFANHTYQNDDYKFVSDQHEVLLRSNRFVPKEIVPLNVAKRLASATARLGGGAITVFLLKAGLWGFWYTD